MATIMRLKKNGFDIGNVLMKKYIAHQQFPNDPTMVQLFTGGASKDEIKKYMMAKQMETMGDAPGGDFMRTLLYRKMTGSGTADDSVSDKELLAAGMFAGKLDQNGASVKPNDAYLMFKFLKMQTKQNAGKVPASTILEIALGEDVASIQATDFEQLFGVDQQEFICLAHENNIRVPCLVNQATVTESTCPAHCCFNPRAADTGDEMIPICYHNLLGKIGAGIARHMINDDNIEQLFGSAGLPTLDDLTDAKDWAEAQMPEVLRRLNKEKGDFYGNPEGQAKWWDNTYNSDEGKFNIYASAAPSTANKKQWKPHGPTAAPFMDQFPGVNPTATPGRGGTELDTYYQMWLDYTDTQDQTECALIHPDARVKCMENYEALKDYKLGTNQCKQAGCCFNEEAFMQGQHACYRASDYGTCENLPSKFQKRECGYDGISEMECLTNARCCYKPTHVASEPWCYYKYSATLEEDEWCEAWNLIENREKTRQPCWENTTGKANMFSSADNSMSDINNLVSQDQCIKAGCCYDAELTKDALNWIVEGLGQTNNMFRCFRKENPALVAGPSGKKDYQEINRSQDGDGNDLTPNSDFVPSESLLTCEVNQWWNPNTIKQSCGENLSYYQCVYINKCCYKATVTNEPTCFKPEEKNRA
jgi:hypothetical protein